MLLGRGHTVPEVCKRLGVIQQTYYRWRKEYGGPKVDRARRLMKLVAELSLDKRMLHKVAEVRLRQGAAPTF